MNIVDILRLIIEILGLLMLIINNIIEKSFSIPHILGSCLISYDIFNLKNIILKSNSNITKYSPFLFILSLVDSIIYNSDTTYDICGVLIYSILVHTLEVKHLCIRTIDHIFALNLIVKYEKIMYKKIIDLEKLMLVQTLVLGLFPLMRLYKIYDKKYEKLHFLMHCYAQYCIFIIHRLPITNII